MFQSIAILSCVFVFNIWLPGTYTMTAEQKQMVHQHFEQVGMECLKTNLITTDDVRNLKERKIPDGENVPCFLACIFKNVGIMDGNGMLQKESAMELVKKVFNDDEEVKVIEDYLHSCSHVNSGAVGDGDKGCERSMLAYKCMVENASQDSNGDRAKRWLQSSDRDVELAGYNENLHWLVPVSHNYKAFETLPPIIELNLS